MPPATSMFVHERWTGNHLKRLGRRFLASLWGFSREDSGQAAFFVGNGSLEGALTRRELDRRNYLAMMAFGTATSLPPEAGAGGMSKSRHHTKKKDTSHEPYYPDSRPV